VLATSKPLLVLAATLLLFHLGNAAMLPLLGQSLVAGGAGDPSAFTGATVVVAQLTMVPMAILAARLAETRGYWIVFVLALLALPIRGVIAAVVTGPVGLCRCKCSTASAQACSASRCRDWSRAFFPAPATSTQAWAW
jgi:hypothetical protein